MSGATPPLPQYTFMACTQLKHRDNFIFYLTKILVHTYICVDFVIASPFFWKEIADICNIMFYKNGEIFVRAQEILSIMSLG
jgi:hypothetical protein